VDKKVLQHEASIRGNKEFDVEHIDLMKSVSDHLATSPAEVTSARDGHRSAHHLWGG
jgi:hypothetical protein